MIEYLKGILDELTPTEATIECGGVGYLCNISLNTYSAVQGKGEVRMFVHEAIREDSWTLYGFATKQERELFKMLISVSGIGGNTARTMLSAFTPSELCDIITNGNDKLLKTVKGLGAKTAQRIIVELRDKVAAFGGNGVIIPERRSAGVTAVAWRTSAGTAARLPVARATNLTRTLKDWQAQGVRVVGLDAGGDTTLDEFDGTDPVVVVVGSEGKGLSRLVRETCDAVLSIPMAGDVESLNASVAAGVVLADIARQRRA